MKTEILNRELEVPSVEEITIGRNSANKIQIKNNGLSNYLCVVKKGEVKDVSNSGTFLSMKTLS